MSLQDTITSLLKELGDTADKVAGTLLGKGFNGNHNIHTCPVANYIRDNTGVKVGVVPSETSYKDDEWCGVFNYIENPPAVLEFVKAFDDGAFPALYKESVE